MVKRSALILCIVCATGMVVGCSSYALAQTTPQTMNYGTLESVFGEPVTTSATGTPQKESDSPANITIITADEIRQSGSRNIPEILERVPGLDVLQSGNNVFDVGVRGYQQPFQSRLLVLVDGRQVFVDDYSRTIWDNIPVNVDDIRQIEVVKGAASALYGSNAAGGVINIITYSPLYDDSNVASLTAGTQNTVTGDATTTFRGDWGGSKTSFGGLTAQEFSTPRSPDYDSSPLNPYHQYVANNTIIKLSPKVTLSTEVNYSTSGGTTDDMIDDGQSAGQATITYSAGAGLTWDSPYGVISSNNYINHSFVNLMESPTDDGVSYGLKTNLVVSQLQDQFTPDADNIFRTAFEYRYKDFQNSGFQEIPQSPALEENTFSASGTWLHKFTHELSWTNAARVDYQTLAETGTLFPGQIYSASDYNTSITAFTGNSDLVYKPTDDDSFRLGYGRGVQMPSFLQYGFTQFYSFGFPGASSLGLFPSDFLADYEGNPDLKPTYVQDYSFDYDRKVAPIYSHIKFSIFYELNQDLVDSFVPSSQSFTYNGTQYPIYTPENIGNSSAYGGEVEIKGTFPSPNIRWDASYSFSRVSDEGAAVPGSDGISVKNGQDYQGSAPQHHLRLLLGYTTGSWELDAFGQLVTSTDMLRGSVSSFGPVYNSGYEDLSARVGYKINDNLTFAVSGTSLNANQLQVSPYPAVQRQVMATVTGRF